MTEHTAGEPRQPTPEEADADVAESTTAGSSARERPTSLRARPAGGRTPSDSALGSGRGARVDRSGALVVRGGEPLPRLRGGGRRAQRRATTPRSAGLPAKT